MDTRILRNIDMMVISLTALVTLLGQPAWAKPPIPEVVHIGFNFPQSGPYALEGVVQRLGAFLAVEEINARGGILNHQIRLIPKDSGSHIRKTQANIKTLLKDPKVKMIFGGVSSDVAIAACALCQEKWVPFFGTLTYSTATTGEEGHRSCFRESYNSWMAAKILAIYMNQHFADQRYFFITADYTWGWTTEQSLRKMTGTTDRQRHESIRTRLGTTNFIEPLQKVKAAAPDVLILTLAGMDLATALRQATVMGIKDQCRIVIPNLTRAGIIGVGPKAMEGVIGAIPWFWQIPYIYDYPRGIQFVERFMARYRDYPTSSAASAYTILYEYKSAVESTGTFDGPAVIRALEGRTYQIAKDPQTWRAFDHQSIQTVYLVRGKPAADYVEQPMIKEHIEILDSLPGHLSARTHEQWLRVRQKAGKPPTLEKFPGD